MVEEIDFNTFKATFLSRSELQRMIEWGAVQSKGHKVVMIMEEGAGGSFFKQALNGVWVQMFLFPEELRDYPTIWAIGTILGVTKEVDMKFMRALDRPKFQVMVLDPDLITHSVDVVIGDFIYELHFKVEEEGMKDNAVLLKMDEKDDTGEGAGKEDLHRASSMQTDHPGKGQRDRSSNSKPNQQPGNSEHQGTKLVLFQIMAPEMADQRTKAPPLMKETELDDRGG
jgi:hypothetical protein